MVHYILGNVDTHQILKIKKKKRKEKTIKVHMSNIDNIDAKEEREDDQGRKTACFVVLGMMQQNIKLSKFLRSRCLNLVVVRQNI